VSTGGQGWTVGCLIQILTGTALYNYRNAEDLLFRT